MDNQKEGKGVFYDHTLSSDKHYFAGYANLAMNNVSEVLKLFEARFRLKRLTTKNFLELCFPKKISDAEYFHRITFLKQFFPVVGFIERLNSSPDYFRSQFGLLLTQLDTIRNFYSHFYHRSCDFLLLSSLLDQLFLQTVKEVRQRKMKDDKTRHLLGKNLKKVLSDLYEIKRKKLEEEKRKGKKVSLEVQDIKNAVLNDAFYHMLYQKESVNRAYKAALDNEAENGITLSKSGLLFILGMFLSRRESEDLRSRVKGFKAKVVFDEKTNDSLKYMATHWVFSFLSFKGAKQLLGSNFSKESLLMQMVDELSKVPDVVYQTFSEEIQRTFIEDINMYHKEGKETLGLDESMVVHPVIRKRYEEKFNYFALRYLDEFADFPTLRFQIHLGNYVHDKRIKKISGTPFSTERMVKQKICVFSKLEKATNLKFDYIKSIEDGEIGWDVFPNPSYNFVANNIPIFLNLQTSKVEGAKQVFGEIKRLRLKNKEEEDTKGKRADKLTKKDITQLIDKDIKGDNFKDIFVGPPTALLSMNEIPALLYDLLCRKIEAAKIEETMIKQLVKRFHFIKEYDEGNKTSTSQITKKLRKAEINEVFNVEKLERAINFEIEVTQQKLNRLEAIRENFDAQNRKSKYLFTTKEIGVESTWLAYDLKRFMPKASRKNLKGYQFSQLQFSIAKYDNNHMEPFNLLRSVWDFDDNSYHWNNWIKDLLLKKKSFECFYKSYLLQRKQFYEHLKEGFQRCRNNDKIVKKFLEQQKVWTIFRKNVYYMDGKDRQLEKLLSAPLVFPRGIFDKKPTFVKDVKVTEQPNCFADWYVYTYKKQHKYQEFYALPMDYKALVEKELLDNKSILSNKNEFSLEERIAFVQLKHNLKIKKVKTTDLFLKLMVEDVYNTLFESKLSFCLSEFYMSQSVRLKKDRLALQQSKRIVGNREENIINDKYVWSKTVPYKNKQINEAEVKLKDIGKFKSFVKSDKVKSLLSYDQTAIWSRIQLEEELFIKPNSYEVIRREFILKEVQDLERSLLKLMQSESEHPKEFESKEGNPNFKKYLEEGILRVMGYEEEIKWFSTCNYQAKDIIDKLIEKPELVKDCYFLLLIRNKFAHNQLLDKEFMSFIIDKLGGRKDRSYSQCIYDYFILVKNRVLRELGMKKRIN